MKPRSAYLVSGIFRYLRWSWGRDFMSERTSRNCSYNDTCFYRSDFLVQCGLHGTSKKHPKGDLPTNETHAPGLQTISNTRGTASIAHFDVPDNGSTEFFINLKHNAHLDTVYGGYCVFAQVESPESFAVVDAIASAIANKGTKPKILRMSLV